MNLDETVEHLFTLKAADDWVTASGERVMLNRAEVKGLIQLGLRSHGGYGLLPDLSSPTDIERYLSS